MGQTLPSGPGWGLSPGERIRTLRLRLRLRQKALALITGVSAKQLGRYERDEISPTGMTLRQLAIALNTSTDYLVGLTDDPRPVSPERTTPDERGTKAPPQPVPVAA